MKTKHKIVIGAAIAGGIALMVWFLFFQPQAIITTPTIPIISPPVEPPAEPELDHPCSNLPDWAKAWGARLKHGC